jgi:4-amino-4-deoxy-L-arabinose transferase-like glycosyltransferase
MRKNIVKISSCIFIFLLTFIPRLYRVNNPVADWHSWRQADTAAVARNFIKEDFNLLYPRSDSFLALNEHGLPNPERFFINEFPFYNGIVALLYRLFGVNTVLARLVSITFASLGALFLYLLAGRLFNQKIALTAGLFYALNPYNIFYGRVIMPDPVFVSLSIASLYFCLLWVKSQKWLHALLLTFTFALAMLVKPYAVFIALPLAYWVLLHQQGKAFTNRQTYFVAIGSLLPLALWRWHYYQHPEGTFASTWLLNGDSIRFSGAFFRWLIFERLNRLIFATGGFVLFIIGILHSYSDKKRGLIFTWLISVIAYMIIFAMGNVNHDYYQLPIMPVGAILMAFGFWAIISQARKPLAKALNALIALSLVLIFLAFGWYEVRGFFNINHPEIVAAGQAVDALLPPDAVVIAPYQGDPAFLYQTNRHGWPIGTEIKAKIKSGATHYVSVNFDDEANWLAQHCPVVQQTDRYIIIDLQQCDQL